MSNLGNTLGTHRAFACVRSCVGASTSNSCGSNPEDPQGMQRGLEQLRALRGGDWEPFQFKRLQEAIGDLDFLSLHGYLVLELRNTDDRELPPKFARLDYGHDGFAVQVSENVMDFQPYFRDILTTWNEACKRHTEALASVEGESMATMSVAAMADFLDEILVKGASCVVAVPGATAQGLVGVGALVAVACGPQIPAAGTMIRARGTMKDVIRAVQAKQNMPYDLVSWNCNHFANHIAEVLAPAPAQATA